MKGIASSIFPGSDIITSVRDIHKSVIETPWGTHSNKRIQICPQHKGVIDDSVLTILKSEFPETVFSLHASPKLMRVPIRIWDCSNCLDDGGRDWFSMAARIHQIYKFGRYSLHAGYKDNCSFETLVENQKRISDLFDHEVLIEGLYPSQKHNFHLSTWEDYSKLLTSGMPYVLDMSHLNILAHHQGRNDDLARELTLNDLCKEIHVSWNDGVSDTHERLVLNERAWWYDLVDLKFKSNQSFELFTEENRKRSV